MKMDRIIRVDVPAQEGRHGIMLPVAAVVLDVVAVVSTSVVIAVLMPEKEYAGTDIARGIGLYSATRVWPHIGGRYIGMAQVGTDRYFVFDTGP